MPRSFPVDGRALSARQVVATGVIGVGLWFAAAMLLRAVGPLGAFSGPGRIVLYLAIIPGTAPFVLATARGVGLGSWQIVPGVAFATATALICDGVAVAWAPLCMDHRSITSATPPPRSCGVQAWRS